jgi:hypothetical protein
VLAFALQMPAMACCVFCGLMNRLVWHLVRHYAVKGEKEGRNDGCKRRAKKNLGTTTTSGHSDDFHLHISAPETNKYSI